MLHQIHQYICVYISQTCTKRTPQRAVFTLGYTNVSVNSTQTPLYTSRKIKHKKSHMTHQMTHHLDSNLRPSKHNTCHNHITMTSSHTHDVIIANL